MSLDFFKPLPYGRGSVQPPPRSSVRQLHWSDDIAPDLKPDLLPPATEDWLLEYPSRGKRSPDAPCRIRVYRQPVMPAVIVATELPINHGTSITNRAELVHAMAWLLAGRPWPCAFVEHNQHSLDGDSYALVTFEPDPAGEGRPQLVPHWAGGDKSADLREFCDVQWRYAEPQAVLELVTAPGAALKQLVSAAPERGDERDANDEGDALAIRRNGSKKKGGRKK